MLAGCNVGLAGCVFQCPGHGAAIGVSQCQQHRAQAVCQTPQRLPVASHVGGIALSDVGSKLRMTAGAVRAKQALVAAEVGGHRFALSEREGGAGPARLGRQ